MSEKAGMSDTGEPPPLKRRRLSLRTELTLALLPTVVVLLVFALVEHWTRQRLLFASLASSAFLIYLDPDHRTNSVRTLVLAQGLAAVIGFGAHMVLGPSYGAAAGAMVVAIVVMVTLDAVHPPAVSTALSFAFGAGKGHNLGLFELCVGLIVLLVSLQRAMHWVLARAARRGR